MFSLIFNLPATAERLDRASNTQHTTTNNQPTIHNKQHTTYNKHHPTNNQQPSYKHNQQQTTHNKPTTQHTNRQPTTYNKQHTTNDTQQTTLQQATNQQNVSLYPSPGTLDQVSLALIAAIFALENSFQNAFDFHSLFRHFLMPPDVILEVKIHKQSIKTQCQNASSCLIRLLTDFY